jgi:hypothetical protein
MRPETRGAGTDGGLVGEIGAGAASGPRRLLAARATMLVGRSRRRDLVRFWRTVAHRRPVPEAGDQQYTSAAATASRHTCAGFM